MSRSTIVSGPAFTCRYIRPIYSPMIPKKRAFIASEISIKIASVAKPAGQFVW